MHNWINVRLENTSPLLQGPYSTDESGIKSSGNYQGKSVPPLGVLRLSAHARRDVPEADVGAFEVIHDQLEAFVITNLLRNIPYRTPGNRCIDIVVQNAFVILYSYNQI